MHILFLPKWYPEPENPQLGSFVREHALAVSLHCKVSVVYAYPEKDKSKLQPNITIAGNLTTILMPYSPSGGSVGRTLRRMEAAKKAKSILEKKISKPDLVHCHVLARTVLFKGYIYPKLPYVVTEHWTGYANGNFTRMPAYRQSIYRNMAKGAKKMTAVSPFLKKSLEDLGFQSDIAIVPNVVQAFAPKTEPNSGTIQIATVSDLVDFNKNITGIFVALAQLESDFQFNIYGDGKDKAILKMKLTDFPSLKGKVKFQGAIPHPMLNATLKDADFFLLNSRFETFSIATAEALTAGIPVLVTKSGGPEQFVTPQNGLAIPKENPEALLAALKQMVQTCRNYDFAAIRKDMETKYSAEAIGGQFYQLYLDIVKP